MEDRVHLGDDGTSVVGSCDIRIRKDDKIFVLLGTVDELSSSIGLAAAYINGEEESAMLRSLQHALQTFLGMVHTGNDPSALVGYSKKIDVWSDRFIRKLESQTSFILPRGCQAASFLHVARCVARRCEIAAVAALDGDLRAVALPLLNRMSTLLYEMARWENKKAGIGDVPHVGEQVE